MAEPERPAHKIGTIFVNPGGPGRGLVTAASAIVAPEVLARFDLVGFDPRGIGGSDPIQCFPTDAEAEALLVIIDGNVDPDQRTNHRLANKFERAGGFEFALGFLAACDAAGPDCAFAGNACGKLDAIRARFRQGPVTLPEFGTVTIDGVVAAEADPPGVRTESGRGRPLAGRGIPGDGEEGPPGEGADLVVGPNGGRSPGRCSWPISSAWSVMSTGRST